MPHKVACMAIYIKYRSGLRPLPQKGGRRLRRRPPFWGCILDVDSLVCYYFGVDSYGFLGF